MATDETPKQILSIDDDDVVRTLVKAILESAKYEVLLAANAQDAFRVLNSVENLQALTCILLDIEMPGMNGLDVLSSLKMQKKTADIPVILMSCKSNSETIEQGYQKGADYFIAKPFTREQLLEGIKLATSGDK